MVYRFYCIVLYHFQTQHHVIYIWYACLFYSRTMLHSCWDSDSCRQIFQYPDLLSRPHNLYRKSAEWVSIANYYTFMRKHVFLIYNAVRHCFQALITFGESIIWASSQKKCLPRFLKNTGAYQPVHLPNLISALVISLFGKYHV